MITNRMRVTCVTALLAAAGMASSALGQLVNVSPAKANSDMIVGTGIPGNNFMSSSGAGTTMFLKARGRDTGQSINTTGNTFTVLAGPAMSNPGASWWTTDFQFTPRSDDVGAADSVLGRNYTLTYQLDSNPSPTGTTFVTVALPLFDIGAGGWDDNDGFFVNPLGGVWTDNTTDYVFSQAWRINFGFLGGTILPPGDYTVNWFAQDDSGYRIAETSMTARVIPAVGPTLSLDAQDSCLQAGDQLVVEVNLNNASTDIVGGQFFLQYNDAALDFVSAVPGDAPFSTEIFELHTPGELTYGVGIPALPGTASASSMARLTFNVTSDFCNVSDLVEFRTGVLPTRITTDTGLDILPNLVDLGSANRDTSAPSITVSNITVNADAGLCTAAVANLGASASDTCDTSPTLVGTRSDSLPLNAPFPTGATTVTWVAADSCGNSSSTVQTVTVNALNTLSVTVNLQAAVAAGPFTRCISFELVPVGGGSPVVSSHTMTFTGGSTGLVNINIPCGNYECITARDPLHTLRATDQDDFADAGVNYVADFSGGDALKGGNLNGDTFIDILDFGIFVGQLSSNPSPGANTNCSTVAPHADVTGNGLVETGDFTFIAINFLQFSENRCDGSLRPGGVKPRDGRMATAAPIEEPRWSVGVGELVESGMGELRFADLNADGQLDSADIAAFMGGAMPVTVADVNGDQAVDELDVEMVKDNLESKGGASDVNRDGVVDVYDLAFVIENLGADVRR